MNKENEELERINEINARIFMSGGICCMPRFESIEAMELFIKTANEVFPPAPEGSKFEDFNDGDASNIIFHLPAYLRDE